MKIKESRILSGENIRVSAKSSANSKNEFHQMDEIRRRAKQAG